MQQLSPADLHILLVEPSDTQRKIISRHLKQELVQHISEADSVGAALAQLKQHQPDLIACALHWFQVKHAKPP
jgi:two-component system chemotaxis response regulator CheY